MMHLVKAFVNTAAWWKRINRKNSNVTLWGQAALNSSQGLKHELKLITNKNRSF